MTRAVEFLNCFFPFPVSFIIRIIWLYQISRIPQTLSELPDREDIVKQFLVPEHHNTQPFPGSGNSLIKEIQRLARRLARAPQMFLFVIIKSAVHDQQDTVKLASDDFLFTKTFAESRVLPGQIDLAIPLLPVIRQNCRRFVLVSRA